MKAANKAIKVNRYLDRLMVEKWYAGGMTAGLGRFFKRQAAKANRRAIKELLHCAWEEF